MYYDLVDALVKGFVPERSVYAQAALSVHNTLRAHARAGMPEMIAELERTKARLLKKISRLHDFRAGSITPLIRRCGKPTCRCAQPGDPGHGPNLRLTYKLGGKTHTESLPDRASVRKAKAEIAEFRKFQRLVKALVEVSARICLLRSPRTVLHPYAPETADG
jgi:hypothetical protein